MQTSNTQLFIANIQNMTVGLRVDLILSFVFNETEKTLSIRYIDNATPERFEGTMAETLVRELRYAGRR